jgi:hypothetical protein
MVWMSESWRGTISRFRILWLCLSNSSIKSRGRQDEFCRAVYKSCTLRKFPVPRATCLNLEKQELGVCRGSGRCFNYRFGAGPIEIRAL